MSLRKRLRRARGQMVPSDLGPARMVRWAAVDCPGCGLPVLFQPMQAMNVCGWCQRTVRRAVG